MNGYGPTRSQFSSQLPTHRQYGIPPIAVLYGVEPKSLSYFPNLTTGNDKVTAQEWLGEVTSAKDVANSNANSNLDESRSEMKSNYKSRPPTDVERGSIVFLRDEPWSD